MNTDIIKQIGKWMERERNEKDSFLRFFILYMCLDAYMTNRFSCSCDKKKINKMIEFNKSINLVKKCKEKHIIDALADLGEIVDMRPEHYSKPKSITDKESFEQIIRCIYQIRCNLFHGSKAYDNDRDKKLCDASIEILECWIDKLVVDE